MPDGHATPDRVAIQLLAWFIRLPDGKLRLATEAEAEKARTRS